MRRALPSAALLAAGAWTLAGVATPAAATPGLPYKDSRAVAQLQLCGKDGQPLTSGSVHDRPFVWRAVSSQRAPKPYDGAGRTATLFAYQPRPQVDAAEWSGDLLTASARYTDAAHPMAAATAQDEPLSDFLATYPTRLDGLVQLRLYLGAPGQPAYTLTYAAATVRVSGSHWQLVGAAPAVSCTSGTSESLETILLSPSSGASSSASASPTGTPASTGSPTAASTVTGSSVGGGAVAAGATEPVAASGSDWRDRVVLGLLVLLALSALVWWWWPYRPRPEPPEQE